MSTKEDGSSLLFVPKKDAEAVSPRTMRKTYRILIVDDDEEVHHVTRLVLRDFTFEGCGIEFLSAYSGEEAKALLARVSDIALILLDVVMESDDAGLRLAHTIRREMGNTFVRIILRTGQPGQAPEREVIVNYDINDYKEKSELTAGKLFTTVTTALRNYRDIVAIDESRKGLRMVIEATARLFEPRSITQLADGVLRQLFSLIGIHNESAFLHVSSFAASHCGKDEYQILSATGQFERYVGHPVQDIERPGVREAIECAEQSHCGCMESNRFVDYFETSNGSRNVIYLEGLGNLGDINRSLIEIFSNNVAVAFDNVYLNQEMHETQKNIVYTLGEVVERRSLETGHHVRRMTELCCLIARRLALSEADVELLRLAAPMHDIGKIAIPDNILHKPGKLEPDEYEIMMTHTTEGYRILRATDQKVLMAAARIALQHHERWNGCGYPQGLAGESIDRFARIAALADVVDALGHERCYKEAWPLEQILDLVRRERGLHFDPAVVDAFLDGLDEYQHIQSAFPG